MGDARKPISYQPTEGLTYDPSEAKYWDTEALRGEIERTFEVCHGCRMCFKFCDSFPTLFSLIDDQYDGDVTRIDAAQTERIMDQCFQCKLCEVQCPYTPRDGHEYQLDFPRLVHRHHAIRARERGVVVAGQDSCRSGWHSTCSPSQPWIGQRLESGRLASAAHGECPRRPS